MRALILWIASVVCISALCAERPQFSDLRAGDSVVAILKISSCLGGRTEWRFHFQKHDAGLVVSAWNLKELKTNNGWVGEVALEEEKIARLDRSLETLRSEQSRDTGSVNIAYFWQCSGVQREERWEDPLLNDQEAAHSIFWVLNRIERFARRARFLENY